MPNKTKTLTAEEEKKQLENAQLQTQPVASTYNSNWQNRINDTIGQIQNREDFSYDVNADALYQQYANQYAQNGKLAMMDTMGRAQTMTGGYGNSYAQSAGQQAYQGYMNQLNDVVPELYDMALKQYMNEGDQLYNELNMMMQQDNTDYGRYQDQLARQEDSFNKLVAMMTSYGYEPTEEEMAAAGMTQAHLDAIKKSYQPRTIVKVVGSPQEDDDDIPLTYADIKNDLEAYKKNNVPVSEIQGLINSAYNDGYITEQQRVGLSNTYARG